MSHVNRIRNAIRLFPQVEFTHTEGTRKKVFVNRLNGERMNFDTPFGNISDRDAKDIAEQLTIEDSEVSRLLKITQTGIKDVGATMVKAINENRCPSDFVAFAEQYERLMERLPRIENYLRKRSML
tara:strand:+ start:368 stop:745 length:378 start_codon:yes stop_codon:yes gene_type:complete